MRSNGLFFIKLSYLVFFLFMIVINYLYQDRISEIAQINKPFIQPANYTFAIWSVIYGWFLCWIIYSFFKTHERDKLYLSLKYLLPLNFTLNALWVLAYTSEHQLLALLFIMSVLLTTLFMYIKTRALTTLGWFNTSIFSMYLGWISVAAVVNLFFFVNNLSPAPWTSLEQTIMTTIALIIITLFAIYILVRENDKLLPLTIVWALIGISFNQATNFITIVSAVLAAFIAIVTIIVFFNIE